MSSAAICIAARMDAGLAARRAAGRRRRHRLGCGVPGAGISANMLKSAAARYMASSFRDAEPAEARCGLRGSAGFDLRKSDKRAGQACSSSPAPRARMRRRRPKGRARTPRRRWRAAIRTLVGIMKEAQFLFAVALAALAVGKGKALSTVFDAAAERPYSTGRYPKALLPRRSAITISRAWRCVIAGRAERVRTRSAHGKAERSSRTAGRRGDRHRRRHLARRRQKGQLGGTDVRTFRHPPDHPLSGRSPQHAHRRHGRFPAVERSGRQRADL